MTSLSWLTNVNHVAYTRSMTKTQITSHLTTDTWTRIADLITATGRTRNEIHTALRELRADGLIRIESDPITWNITEADRAAAIVIGGEDMHVVIRL